MENKITQLFNIEYPIIQAGMVWCAPWELASAVSNAGGLGLIGSASMYPDILKTHIKKCKEATSKPFGVNVALLYPDMEEIMNIIVEEGVKIVFTSAGNPKTWTPFLKEHGITVVHVIASIKFAQKSQEAGVDAVVAEGFEAGGHNGREETTTFCLVPMIRDAVDLPLLAAGGVASGRQMLAAMTLGADGVQIGSRFVASEESSAHINFKNKVVDINEGSTKLSMKKLVPVRMVKNKFYNDIQDAENKGATPEELKELLGKARAKKGMFEGDLEEGELEIGQISASIHDIKPAEEIVKNIWTEYLEEKRRLCVM
ncbi:MAG: nitronate monooxygenase [Bacteroidetes bacterium]|nr:nitronate monooxygenase [Bacteroidia bacterium]MBN4052362.1 nitronate monooxygenase [Sphingobacteriaceae bacterium AH-315-L07]PCH69823.1 MAG: nitronate monooxygenase [Bacteroidota bacterium]